MIESQNSNSSDYKQRRSTIAKALDSILQQKKYRFQESIRLSQKYENRVRKRKLNMNLLQNTQKSTKCQRIIKRLLDIATESDLIPCIQQIYQLCSNQDQKTYEQFDLRLLNKLLQIARESQQIQFRSFYVNNKKMMLKRKILQIITNYFSKVEKAILPVDLVSYLIQELHKNQNQEVISVVLICLGNIAHYKEIKTYLFQNHIMELLIKLNLNKRFLDDLSFMLINLVNGVENFYRKQFLKILQYLQNLFLKNLDQTTYLQDFIIILKQLYKTQNKQFQIDLINLNEDFLLKILKFWENNNISYGIFQYIIELFQQIFRSHTYTDKIYKIQIIKTLLQSYERFKQNTQIRIWKIVNKFLESQKGSSILKIQNLYLIVTNKIQMIDNINSKQYYFQLIKIILNISTKQYIAPYDHQKLIQIIIKKLPDSYEPYTQFLLKKLYFILNQNKQVNCKYFLAIQGFSIINKICLYDEQNSSHNTAAAILYDFRDYLEFDKLDQINEIELQQQIKDQI